MKNSQGEKLEKDTMKSLLILIIAVFLFSGCGFIAGFQKEAKEEKKILGYIEGFNPRIKEMQNVLKEVGFNPGSIDGTIDKQTRKAIRDFQRAEKLTETGFIDAKTWSKLNSYSLERTKKKQGISAEEIKNRLKSPEWRKRVQQALKNAGFNPGPINGTMTDKTKKGIVAFQKSKGLADDGMIGPKTWEELSKYFPRD